MSTPRDGYFVDGKRVPSVTTILGRFKESGGLIHWSWKTAFDGLTVARSIIEDLLSGTEPAVRNAKHFVSTPIGEWDYRTKRDKAADAGTIAHEMMDAQIRGIPFDAGNYSDEMIVKAIPAFEAFCQWAQQSRFEIAETEVQLTSKQYLFGGTRDAILIDGKRSLGDWKCSNRIYPEYLCQLAAYGLLDEENGFSIDGGYHLLRFSRQEEAGDPVQFSHHYWSQLDAAREAFLLMRRLYDLMKGLERLAR